MPNSSAISRPHCARSTGKWVVRLVARPIARLIVTPAANPVRSAARRFDGHSGYPGAARCGPRQPVPRRRGPPAGVGNQGDDPRLSVTGGAGPAAVVPVLPKLLALRRGGGRAPRTVAGLPACRGAAVALPPVGRQRLRPRPGRTSTLSRAAFPPPAPWPMEQRNLLLAIVLSVGILIAFQYVFEKVRPTPTPAPAPATATQTLPSASAPGVVAPNTAVPGAITPG